MGLFLGDLDEKTSVVINYLVVTGQRVPFLKIEKNYKMCDNLVIQF